MYSFILHHIVNISTLHHIFLPYISLHTWGTPWQQEGNMGDAWQACRRRGTTSVRWRQPKKWRKQVKQSAWLDSCTQVWSRAASFLLHQPWRRVVAGGKEEKGRQHRRAPKKITKSLPWCKVQDMVRTDGAKWKDLLKAVQSKIMLKLHNPKRNLLFTIYLCIKSSGLIAFCLFHLRRCLCFTVIHYKIHTNNVIYNVVSKN